MVDDILSYRADFYRLNKISDKLVETNAHVMIARLPSTSVPSNPGAADNASSGAEDGAGDANPEDSTGATV
jgi:hypothetical protein